MVPVSIVGKGLQPLANNLKAAIDRCKGIGGLRFHSYVGQLTAKTLVPETIKTNAAGYPSPRNRPGGTPLYDTGYMVAHLAWKASEKDVSVYTYVPYAGVLQHGGTWLPRRRGRTAKGRRRWERGGKPIVIRAYWWLTWRPEYRRIVRPLAADWYWRGIVPGNAPPYGGNPGTKPTGRRSRR